jgi:hypothetical protein
VLVQYPCTLELRESLLRLMLGEVILAESPMDGGIVRAI